MERVRSQADGDLTRYVAKVVLLAVAYYVAAKLGLRLSLVRKNVTPLWPPTGIAVAAFVVFGRRLWPGVALGAFLVNLPISSNAVAAAVTAVGNTLAPFAAAMLLELVRFRRDLARPRDAMAIVFLAGLVSMGISATIGTTTLVVSNQIPAHKYLSTWGVWWTGDTMGVLVVAPFLLTIDRLVRWQVSIAQRIEWILTLLGIGLVTYGVLNTSIRMFVLVIPCLVWAAWRFQQRGAAPGALIAAGLAVWAAAHNWVSFMFGTLFERMASLQVFNATVAFSSLMFAALVSERVRDRDALERSATELEERVTIRTGELIGANELLAEAQRLAGLGSWDWDIRTGEVSWSDELYRIHGLQPGGSELMYEQALEMVDPADAERIRANIDAALRVGRDHELPPVEYRIRRPDGEERYLLGRARVVFGTGGEAVRMVGTVQDVTETKRAEREHRIAETLQRSLLPQRLPQIPGVLLAARYVPASADMEVGGDWYDVVPLPNGQVGLAVGDVAGHGLRAASIMGQLRMALRAYAMEDTSPAKVVGRLHQLSQRMEDADMATLVYGVYDPESSRFRFASAGHLPPLLVDADGHASYVEVDVEPPIGAVAHPDGSAESELELPAGATLLLFTDGLVERRGESINDGLGALKGRAARNGHDLESLCDQLLWEMVGRDVSDDIALLALRPLKLAGTDVRLRVPASPEVLAQLRQTLRRWLRELGADPTVVNELLIASGEAWANAIQHAYGAGEGTIDVELRIVDGAAEIVTRDSGTWRQDAGGEGGRGLLLMRGVMDSVDVVTGDAGTTITMRKRL